MNMIHDGYIYRSKGWPPYRISFELEHFVKWLKLYKEDQPEKEPFKFKYEAKEILQKLSKIDDYESNVKGALLYFIGKINYETEDRVAAEQERFIIIWKLNQKKNSTLVTYS